MVYTRYISLAAIGILSLHQIEGRQDNAPSSDEISLDLSFEQDFIEPRIDLDRVLDGTAGSGGIPANICLTEEQCKAQIELLGYENYYVDDTSHIDTYGCFAKNDKAFWGTGGTDLQNAVGELVGIKERILCGEDSTAYVAKADKSLGEDPANDGYANKSAISRVGGAAMALLFLSW